MNMLAVLPSLVAGVRTWRGPATSAHTLEVMRTEVRASYERAAVVETAARIAMEAPEKNRRLIVACITDWLRAHTRYVDDPVGQQRLKSPLLMLAQIARDGESGGDCTDIAMLSAAIGLAVGLDAKFVAEGYGSKEQGLTHVYTILDTGTGWLAVDTQRMPGSEAAPATLQRIVSVL